MGFYEKNYKLIRRSAEACYRSREVELDHFPIKTYARVRVKGVTSKLRLKMPNGSSEYQMEVMFGDATKQIEMTVHDKVIERYIGKI